MFSNDSSDNLPPELIAHFYLSVQSNLHGVWISILVPVS